MRAAGLDPARAALADVEAAFCADGARLLRLDPEAGEEAFEPSNPRRPRYQWTRSRPDAVPPR